MVKGYMGNHNTVMLTLRFCFIFLVQKTSCCILFSLIQINGISAARVFGSSNPIHCCLIQDCLPAQQCVVSITGIDRELITLISLNTFICSRVMHVTQQVPFPFILLSDQSSPPQNPSYYAVV